MITHVGFVRDHSGSMSHLAHDAMKDYNDTLENIRKQDTTFNNVFTNVVECGVGHLGLVSVPYNNNKRAKDSPSLTRYVADGGGTPLYDSVMKIIEILQTNEKIRNQGLNPIQEGVAYLVMVTTDGLENRSKTSAIQLTQKIKDLNATDLWTFVFRVPKGHKHYITSIGVPEGNVMEWEQTAEDLRRSSIATVSATSQYFDNRNKGITRSTSFYTDLSSVNLTDVKRELNDITNQVRVEPVWSEDQGTAIRDFCNNHFGEYKIGNAYYELTKTETIQSNKNIIIKHKKSGKYYSGPEARDLLGLPSSEIKVIPGNHDKYEIYVQSTSVNRKLMAKTKILYWKS